MGDVVEVSATLGPTLGHEFTHRELLIEALTHPSAARRRGRLRRGYDRLEFLGDRVLGLIVAELLWRRFPQEAEGELTRRHTDLVRHEALADLSIGIENEANLAAMAELSSGAHGPTFLYVSGEVGIGSGIAVDGAIFRGRHGWSGEIGHVTVHSGGRLCTCGARGCLE